MTIYAKRRPFEDLVLNLKGKEIVIMDRNIWAKTNNRTSHDAQWYLFQRWNNYWFDLGSNNNLFPNKEKYEPEETILDENHVSNYYKMTYLTGTSWYEYREDALNLWWWESDIDEDKQGPCPKCSSFSIICW